MSRAAMVALVAVAVALASCGGSASPQPTTTTTPPPPRPDESVDRQAKLPQGWSERRNRRGGFSFGLPRGWRASDSRATTLVRSFDRLVAISVTPDRSREGLAVALDEYATRTMRALDGFRPALRPRPPTSYGHRYDATEVVAAGNPRRKGIAQRVRVIALRRPGVVTLTAVVAANARRATNADGRLAGRVLATVRSRPPVGARPGDGRDR